jgi:hypothetical protein
MKSFFEAPLQEIMQGLEIAFENGGKLAEVSFSSQDLVGNNNPTLESYPRWRAR